MLTCRQFVSELRESAWLNSETLDQRMRPER